MATRRRKIARSAVKRVKRHTKASKNAKRKVRSYHSRKHRKLVKKGGGRFSAYETSEDYADSWTPAPAAAAPTEEQGTAYVLYDEIQTINVPMCVIFIVPKTFVVDDIYLFFNRNMTAEDITLTVKLLLGISVDFKLTPAITPPSSTAIGNTNSLRKFIGNTFVKLTSCGVTHPRTFCLKTGTLSDNLELDKDKVMTTHKIETADTTYQSLDGKKIKAFLARSNPNGFTKKVLESKAVLPDLYKKYFIAVSEEVPEVTEDKINEYYGNDLEPDKPSWNTEDKETYDAFKERMKKNIQNVILNASKHTKYGLDSNSVNTLNANRPLNITDPMSIKFSTLVAENIIKYIHSKCQNSNIQFTELSENWWVQTELKEVEYAKEYVQRRKNARITPCVDYPTGTACCEINHPPEDCH